MMSKNNLNRFISFVYKNNRKKFLLSILLVFIGVYASSKETKAYSM